MPRPWFVTRLGRAWIACLAMSPARIARSGAFLCLFTARNQNKKQDR